MKINLLTPLNPNEQVYRGLNPGLDMIKYALIQLGHEVYTSSQIDPNGLNLVFWQFAFHKTIRGVEHCNKHNTAWIQVENIDGFKLWGNDIMMNESWNLTHEEFGRLYFRERDKTQFTRWGENQNVWDYSSCNAKHFKDCHSWHKFEWGYQKECERKVFNADASRGLTLYGGSSPRRKDLCIQLAQCVDFEYFTGVWGDGLYEKIKNFSVVLSIGSTAPSTHMKASRFERVMESLRIAEALHCGFPVLVEKATDIEQNVHWSEFAVVSPLLNLLPNAIDLLSNEKYVEVAKEKTTAFKEKTSMARTLERLLDETFV